MRFIDRLILSRTEESIHLRCPAKANLFLKVVGKRTDGYHEVQNVMQTVTLFDELKLHKKSSGIVLTCSQNELAASPEQNLVFKAAELFFKKGCATGGAHLDLKKNIPVAAGLGGGSSDAACCLLALNELFGSELSPDSLRSMAAELGSDVPFFVEGGTALCTGRGDVVKKLRDAPPFVGILVSPGSPLKTSEMYASLTSEDFRGPDVEEILRPIKEGDLRRVCSSLFNAFERVAFQKLPELQRLKRELDELGSMGTVLCGSGPTILAIFPRFSQAASAVKQLRQHLEHGGFIALVGVF